MTFLSLDEQNPEDGYNRMKRVILIGDHHQVYLLGVVFWYSIASNTFIFVRVIFSLLIL